MCSFAPGRDGVRPRMALIDALRFGQRGHAHVHLRLSFGRDDVGPRPTAHDPDVDRRPDVVVIQRVQRQHLLRQLVDRADALLRLDTGVRGATLDAHHVVTRALARGLQRAARQR